MSHILSALKQAEKDRKRGASLSMDDIGSASWDHAEQTEGTVKTGVWLVVLLAALMVAVLGYWIVSSRAERPATHQAEEQTTPLVERVSQAQQAPAPQNDDPHEVVGTRSTSVAPATGAEGFSTVAKPALVITGVLWIEGAPDRSRIFIDDQSYRVGDEIVAGMYLIEIAESVASVSDGVAVFEYALNQ